MLSRLFNKNNWDIALIQEPWTSKGRVKGLPSQTGKLIYNTEVERTRTAILCRSTYNTFSINQFICRDITAVSLEIPLSKGGKLTMNIASCYFPGDGNDPPPEEVQSFINYCTAQKQKFIIGCDANSHHTVWGSTDTNTRGEQLFEFCLLNNIAINNTGNEPTFVNAIRKEVLDLTMSDMGTSSTIRYWHVSEEPSLSDHRYVRFDIRIPQKAGAMVRIPKRTNWPVFTDRLQDNLAGLQNSIDCVTDLDNVADNLTRAIIDAYHSSSPQVRVSGTRDVPWWTSILETKRKTVRKLFNRAKRTDDWATYRTALTHYNEALRKSKRDSWRTFCEKIDEIPAACRLQKALALEHKNPLGSVRRLDGTLTTTREETLDCLVRGHFPECTVIARRDEDDGSEMHTYLVPREAYKRAMEIFTPGEIHWAINSFGPFKSPGGDGVYPIFLQRGLYILEPFLIKLFRASFSLEYIPRCWREVRVIFIPKTGNKPPEDIRSYRPISLTSFILKTMEKILGLHIRSNIIQRSPLDPSQHAYQAGKSTETALHELTSEIEDTLRNKEALLCSFIDIQGAFDNTKFEVIREQALTRNIDSSTIGWIINMLKRRRIIASIGEVSIAIAPTRGCPQGGVLSPLLWLLVMDHLLATLRDSRLSTIAYADDLVLMVKGKFESTIFERMQYALGLVNKWCGETGLRVNPSKITCTLFTNRRKIPCPPITLNGVILKMTSEVKYLGIIFDQRLTWNPLLKYITKKANNAYFACRRLFGKTWGLNPQMIIWLYQTIIRPIIAYAAVVWWPKTEQLGAQVTLNKIQRLICLSASGATRTCPTAALERLMGLAPLHLYIKRVAGSRAIKLKTTGQVRLTRPGHNSILDKLVLADETTQLSDMMVKTIDCRRNFTIRIPGRDLVENIISSLPQHASVWYADGSKSNQGTGAGVVGPGVRICFPLGKTPTVFQAETVAIETGVLQCLKKKYKRTEIYIISDSQAVLSALAGPVFSSKLTWSCYNNLKKLGRDNRVTLMWSPGHTNILGNKAADTCAKEGAGGVFYGPEPSVAYSKGYVARRVLSWEQGRSVSQWESSLGMRQAKKLLNYNFTNLKDILKMDRSSLKSLTWYLTGHGPFNYHLYKLGKSPTEYCRFCDLEQETAEHLLFGCSALAPRRLNNLNAYTIQWPNADPIDVHDLVAFIKDLDLKFE